MPYVHVVLLGIAVALGVLVPLWLGLLWSRERARRATLAAQVGAMLQSSRAKALSLPPPVLDGSDFVAYFNDAVARKKARDLDGARRSIDTSLLQNPSYYLSYLLRAELCLLARDARGAVADYTKGLGLLPTEISGAGTNRFVRASKAEAYYQRAKAFLDLGDETAGRRDLEKAERLGHESAGGALHILDRGGADARRARSARASAS